MTTESDPAPVAAHAPSGYEFAGPAIRLAAVLIDAVLLFVVFFGLFVVFGAFVGIAYPSIADTFAHTDGWLEAAVGYLVTSSVMLAWFGGWQSNRGATPGMLAMKLRVRGPDGQSDPTLRAAVIRNAPQVLAGFVRTGHSGIDLALSAIGIAVYITIGLSISNSPTRQGFHDRLAGGTLVLRRER